VRPAAPEGSASHSPRGALEAPPSLVARSSVARLRWAVRQAGFTGATLEAVIGWQFPAFFGWAPVSSEDVDFGKVVQQTLTETLDEVLGPDRPAPAFPERAAADT
jgi:hypothetical protein